MESSNLTTFRLEQEYTAYLEKVIQEADDALFKSGREYAALLEKVRPFPYKHKTYRLVNIFTSSQRIRCNICGNCPITVVFIIRSEDGQRLKVGNTCIDRLTNQEVSTWYRNYQKKRETIIKYSKKINHLSSLLKACKKCELPCSIPFRELEKIRTVLDQMCKGIRLNWQQEQIAEQYAGKKERLCFWQEY